MKDQEKTTIIISSRDYALAIQTNASNELEHIYFGQKLNNEEDYVAIPEQLKYDKFIGLDEDRFNGVYTPSGTWNTANTALEIKHHDANASTELTYQSHRVENPQPGIRLTVIELQDPLYKTQVRLFFKVYEACNIFEQWVKITNTEVDTIQLGKMASANLYFRGDRFYLTQFHGTWAREMNAASEVLRHGTKVLKTKLGTRAHLYNPPSFQLAFNEPATEEAGKVMLGHLAWSGNFQFEFEIERYENLRLIAGLNPYASEYHLAPGDTFETPAFLFSYSEHGIGAASRQLHRWARAHRIWDGNGERLTLLNNWEATFFDFEEDTLVELFDGAQEIGVDCFLLDDGWFGNKYPRYDDTSSLGDWQVNHQKLPQGISYLVKKAEEKGLRFGIWIEPEMVNPRSELYEQHLDWVIRQPERPEIYFRNQLVLDLSNPEVQDNVFGVLDDLMTENPDLAYIKWDCNAVIYNAYSAFLEKANMPQSHLYIEYVRGLYRVLERVRQKYPKIPIMLCSGGGGRVDYGALRYFTEFWPSDNTGPIDRIYMHWNYSRFFPANTLCAHVTDWDKNASLKFRTDVACMGKLGFDIDVRKLSPEEKAFCKNAVRDYNLYKKMVWHGDQYRLRPPNEKSYASFLFVDEAKDRAIMFAYLVTNRFEINYTFEPVRLQGLDPEKKYQFKEINVYSEVESPLNTLKSYSGDYLMKAGFNPHISAERRSVVIKFTAE